MATTASIRNASRRELSRRREPCCPSNSGSRKLPPHRPRPHEPPASYFLIRGDWQAKGNETKPGFVTVATCGNPPTEIPRPDGHTVRPPASALAQWLTSRENPVPARVMVNRIWAAPLRPRHRRQRWRNFGKMGDPPTHAELLDWLAVEFMNRGWSIKQMHRLMMTSEAYQMASRYDDAASAASDPNDDYLWRFRIQRLDAEIVRDSIMAAAGTIDVTMGGPPVFPHIQDELLKAVSFSRIAASITISLTAPPCGGAAFTSTTNAISLPDAPGLRFAGPEHVVRAPATSRRCRRRR